MLLKNYVPFFISNIKEMQNIYSTQQKEIDKLNLDVKDLKAQCFVKTATWGLSWWEEFVSITTDTSKSIEERRANILAKLRGQGTTTKKVIEEIAQAYADKVRVTEHNKESYFSLALESINKGFSYSLNSLYNIIEEIQPAHLEATYNLISTTNSNLYLGTTLLSAETTTIYPYTPKAIRLNTKLNIATGNAIDTETTIIYPKEDDK
ncbi:YmfQ family protein [Clostridium botulinum C]|uniref:putative phage tail protein n=1 Tax=Clostridium botulinum TaxID=1491 RepID=UPI001E655235|nr:YmfQ family protein [Clostridium botulinum C]MCD3209581.1 YmfQ family protein [Clostridium botulinum C]MCD3226563.1 YmfQ family protein [Clostridium botulinum C]MCD3248997.1 YmfQ family protein [Clostridium botulinum C]MCD3257559.1 YmfQ family protein [Clostridium botulinum C]